jgi:hypothetical protein
VAQGEPRRGALDCIRAASGGPEPARAVGRFEEARSLSATRQVDKSFDALVVLESTPDAFAVIGALRPHPVFGPAAYGAGVTARF